jgi:hypothetical protein
VSRASPGRRKKLRPGALHSNFSLLAKRLNASLAFFCYDLLSIVEPRQVFQLVALYLDKFGSICQGMLHDCKLNFIQIVSDHDLFLELPGRDPTERLVFLPVWSQYVNLPSIDKQVLS